MKISLAEKPYFAIQGEGKNTGKPLIIVRLSGCNLRCGWCDSKYTWENKNSNLNFETDEFVKYLNQFNTKKITHILFTGGEPTLQKESLMSILQKIKNQYTFEIETNGTLNVTKEFIALFELYNVSLKLKNSANKCLNEKLIKLLVKQKNVIFKFVIASSKDLTEITEIQKKYQIKAEKIYLMPEGTTARKIQTNSKMIIPYCLDFGYNFTTRLHILVYGNKKGV